jgi:aspartate-semialdehyde dehydrogenase
MGGHSESANVDFENEFDLNELVEVLRKTKGVIVKNDNSKYDYPMPKDAHDKDEVFVGRIRRDETQPKTVNLWIVADNLRKGAATNAVQIAEYLVKEKVLAAASV